MIRWLLFVIPLAACTDDHQYGPDELIPIVACHNKGTDDFDLGNVTDGGGGVMFVEVFYGGCAGHGFEVCWNGTIFSGIPPEVEVVLTHDAHGDTCQVGHMADLQVDTSFLTRSTGVPVFVDVVGTPSHFEGTDSRVTLFD